MRGFHIAPSYEHFHIEPRIFKKISKMRILAGKSISAYRMYA
ncbi:hypothetical protein HMPREF9069_00953 [Atopobium sp. oral taxon 810 str. F0209]|nr:hypothetical protein HMPREF9069_00953 [Atopobium sp. oral taxon 810 str. F0209]